MSKSGFYKYLQRKSSKWELENQALSEEIKLFFEEHCGRYGTIRITKALAKKGIHVNRKHVGRLLHKTGVYVKGSRYRYEKYNRKAPTIDRPNLLKQVFKTDAKNKVWLGDITYIPTKQGTLYLAVILDLYTRITLIKCAES
ncbi:IS3 family transposase [Listeria grandensis]|uniref:IS3 family transposase n=1 Tax=Listeria grandensis TaxID=1494963 RepID=UPI0016275D67|nr:IS3 family transposase [Listeria grandensis]MBC1476004.1 IS3 family transposase [Listeria grandensis]